MEEKRFQRNKWKRKNKFYNTRHPKTQKEPSLPSGPPFVAFIGGIHPKCKDTDIKTFFSNLKVM